MFPTVCATAQDGIAAGDDASAKANQRRVELDSAAALFNDLDQLAFSCLDEVSEQIPLSATADSPCQVLLQRLDGEPIARYLESCTALRAWRDEHIGQTDGPVRIEEQPASIAQQLIDVEFYCGEAALSRRTRYVLEAFNLMRAVASRRGLDPKLPATSRSNVPDAPGVQLPQVETTPLSRVQGQTERLWRQLELDLLRLQLERQRGNTF